MALDEIMLDRADGPWMRVYQWAEPSLSIGFSQALTKIPADKAHWPWVRRWTGGGVVEHDGDWTYTLAVPASEPLSGQNAVQTYRWIHECMIAGLLEVGIDDCELQSENTSDGMGVCFVEPAKFDVVWKGQKIAGAAQRRGKTGLLHQGTVQPLQMPSPFAIAFARKLADEVTLVSQRDAEASFLETAQGIATAKYATEAWNLHRTAPKPAPLP